MRVGPKMGDDRVGNKRRSDQLRLGIKSPKEGHPNKASARDGDKFLVGARIPSYYLPDEHMSPTSPSLVL